MLNLNKGRGYGRNLILFSSFDLLKARFLTHIWVKKKQEGTKGKKSERRGHNLKSLWSYSVIECGNFGSV